MTHEEYQLQSAYEIAETGKVDEALSLVCAFNFAEHVGLLVDKGANPNAYNAYTPSIYKRSLLHIAAEDGYHKVVWALLERGALPSNSLRDAWGLRPLHYAARHGHEKVIEVLREFGPESFVIESWTPMHEAMEHNQPRAVHALVKYGFPATAKEYKMHHNQHWRHPLLVAFEKNHADAALALAEHGASVSELINPSYDLDVKYGSVWKSIRPNLWRAMEELASTNQIEPSFEKSTYDL